MRTAAAVLFCSAALVGQVMATGPSDAARGAQLYDSRCSSCHSLDQNLVGPRHRGVYGRRAGSLDDFTYSPALKQAQITWNDETLDRWLAAPRRLVPGVRMCFSVSNSADRRALIEYLKSDAAQ